MLLAFPRGHVIYFPGIERATTWLITPTKLLFIDFDSQMMLTSQRKVLRSTLVSKGLALNHVVENPSALRMTLERC